MPVYPRHDVIDPKERSKGDVYRLMTDLVAPRPIGWVSTVDSRGRRNLAPFSFFQAVSYDPPMVSLSFTGGHRTEDGRRPKDTLANILESREFTVNHVSRPLVEAANATSGEYAADVSEWDHAVDGAPLVAAPAQRVAAPRVAAAKASLECRLVHAIPLGRGSDGTVTTTLVLGRVVCFTVAAGLLRTDDKGRLRPMDPAQLAAVGRMGGIAYTDTSGRFELPRPKVP
jgi:flavin reductase (DIM6/NTAB) family NADH-FMN oxidoreductase RutF